MWVLARLGFWCSWQTVSLENLTETSPSLYFRVCLWLPSLGSRGGSSVWHIFNLPRTQKSGKSSATCSALCQLQQNPSKTSLSLLWGSSSTQRKTGIISSIQRKQQNLWTRGLQDSCVLWTFPVLQSFSMRRKWFCGLSWSPQDRRCSHLGVPWLWHSWWLWKSDKKGIEWEWTPSVGSSTQDFLRDGRFYIWELRHLWTQNYQGWKRLPRSPSPTLDQISPRHKSTPRKIPHLLIFWRLSGLMTPSAVPQPSRTGRTPPHFET